MKTIYLLLFVLISVLGYAQDDSFCICMLDQPAYSAEQDQTYTAGNDFNEFLSPQTITENTENNYLFLMIEESVEEESEELMLEEEIEPVADRGFIKKKKKKHYIRWNAHKKPKKYKGKCPFF